MGYVTFLYEFSIKHLSVPCITKYLIMKPTLILLLSLLILSNIDAQTKKIKENDLIGTTWKLHVDIEDVLNEVEEEMEEEDNIFGEIILRGVSGLVEGILENIDIYFDFRSGNEVKVYVEAFGADEIEYTEWRINRRGELIIEDSEHFQSDVDGYWILENGVLVLQEDDRDEGDPDIFMVRMD